MPHNPRAYKCNANRGTEFLNSKGCRVLRFGEQRRNEKTRRRYTMHHECDGRRMMSLQAKIHGVRERRSRIDATVRGRSAQKNILFRKP